MWIALVNAAPCAKRAASLVGVCLALAGSIASAQPVLTFDHALRLAQDRSRQIVAQDYAAASAREMAVAAAQLPDPTLRAGINDLPVNGPDRFRLNRDDFTMRMIGISQRFTREDKRKARAARYEREAEAAGAGRTLALADLQRDTAVAWLDRYYQERVREVLAQQHDETRLQIEAADAAYRGARGSQADVFLARSAVALIDDRLAQTERQIEVATTRLARWVGAAANQPLGAAPNIGATFGDADIEQHIYHHPQIELLVRQEQVARAEVDLAQANKRSDWTVELRYGRRQPEFSDLVSINFSIPWQIDRANRQDRELAAKLALIDQLQAQREEVTREHLADVRSWLQQWQSNRARLARYDDSLIPLSVERTRAALAAYRGNSTSLSAVLEARRMEIDTRLERIRLEMETAAVWAQLEYLFPAARAARGEFQ